MGYPMPSQPSQQHPQMHIAGMIQIDLIGIYIYKTDQAGQQRLAKGPGSARFQISQV
jgi:hypothetical protein